MMFPGWWFQSLWNIWVRQLVMIIPNIYIYIYIWLVVWTPLKNIGQLGWLFPIYGKINSVPNHQPDRYGKHIQPINQSMICPWSSHAIHIQRHRGSSACDCPPGVGTPVQVPRLRRDCSQTSPKNRRQKLESWMPDYLVCIWIIYG